VAGEPTLPDDLAAPGVHAGRMLQIAAGLLLFLAASFGILYAIFRWQIPPQASLVPRQVPGPGLLQDERKELLQLRTDEKRRLQAFGWVDRDKQIVAIPIERAMQLIAKRGADGYAPIASEAPAGQGQDQGQRPTVPTPPAPQGSSAPGGSTR
jgi:hypothetical protein